MNKSILGVILAIASLLALTWFMMQNTEEIAPTKQEIDTKLSTKTTNIEYKAAEPVIPTGGPAPQVQGCVLFSKLFSHENGYTVTINNIGTRTCKNASFSIYYSEGEEYRHANPLPSASDYYWRLNDIKRDGMVTVAISVNKVVGAELCATADNAPADACARAQASVPIESEPGNAAPTADREYGVWVWDPLHSMSKQKMDTIIAQAQNAGFNSIYLTIDDALTTDKEQFTRQLALFVGKANAKGLSVDAEWGWRDWAKPENRHKAFALIDFIKEYNAAHPKIRAVQSDVEPYLLLEYEVNKAAVLADFVAFIEESAQRLAGSDIGFSVVIPHFYDKTQAWTPRVVLGGKSDYVYSHILSILDRTEGNSIVIMAYRDFFEGAGGTKEITEPEIKASSGKTKIVVAQETGNVEPGYVTFYGQSRADILAQLNSINTYFSKYPGFGGTAIHYLDSFLELE